MFEDVLVLRKQAQAEKPKHIRVRFDESDDWYDYVPVTVEYQLPNGKRLKLPARQIRSYKALGVLPS